MRTTTEPGPVVDATIGAHGPEANLIEYSADAKRRLGAAWRALFTPTMTVVILVVGGEDVTLQPDTEIVGLKWRTGRMVLPPRPGARAVGVSILNARGELVAQLRTDPPAPWPGERELILDPLVLAFMFGPL